MRYIRDVKICALSKNKQKNIKKIIRGFSSNDISTENLFRKLQNVRLQLGIDQPTSALCNKCRNKNKKCPGGCINVNYGKYIKPLPALT